MSIQQDSEKIKSENLDITEEMAGAIEYRMPEPLNLEALDNLYPQWQRFKQGFKIFISAAGLSQISENRKASILLNCIGQAAQELYFNTLVKDDEVNPKLEDVIQSFEEYFVPKCNEVINTFNYNKRSQEEGESFDSFYTQIRKLAANCKFDTQLDRMLRDRIVVGINNHRTQQKLLEIKELTLDQAVNICRSAEMSKEHVKVLAKQSESAVDTVQARRSHHYSQQRQQPEYKAKYINFRNQTPNTTQQF